MATSDVDICNSALFLLGADEISSLSDDESDNAATLARLYEPFKEAKLTEYPWHWARELRQMSRDATSPVTSWRYRFIIPAESIRVHDYYASSEVGARPVRDLERIGDYVYTDRDELYVQSTEDKSEADWPRLFEQFFTNALAAEIAIAVTGKESMYNMFAGKAYGGPAERGEGGLYAKAKAWDATQTPPSQVHDFSLINARFGGSGVVTDERLR
jgi:hypothetical protein